MLSGSVVRYHNIGMVLLDLEIWTDYWQMIRVSDENLLQCGILMSSNDLVGAMIYETSNESNPSGP